MINNSFTTRLRSGAIALGCAVSMLWSAPSARADASFGSISLIDSAGGSYILNYITNTSAPNVFTLILPNFSIGDLNAGSLNFGLTINLPSYQTIQGLDYTLSGAFSGGGTGNGTLDLLDAGNAGNFSNTGNAVFPPPFATGTLTLPVSAQSALLSSAFNLDTNGATPGSAGISTLTFTVHAIPEPGTYLAGALALGLIGYGLRRRGRQAKAAIVAVAVMSLQVTPSEAQVARRVAERIKEAPVSQKGGARVGAGVGMTDFARIAAGFAQQRALGKVARQIGNKIVWVKAEAKSVTDGGPQTDPGDEDETPFDPDAVFVIPGGQAEYSMAVDSTGMHIVVGFNDTRGFSTTPVSVSGYYYSDDGGTTFVDGGQLPVNFGGTTVIGTTTYPQIFGDTDVKYAGGNNFVVSSILVKAISATGTAQTLCVHRSTDFGHTWQGPFEVTAATNPNGFLSGANGADSADKEFMEIDPSTGRVVIAWTNFKGAAAGGNADNLATTCANIFTATPPTWTTGSVIFPSSLAGGFPQGVQPRVKGDGLTIYAATNLRNKPNIPAIDPSGYTVNNIGFSRSTDNGATWSAPLQLAPTDFQNLDQIPGNDRVHSFPFMAVDRSGGPNAGNIYVVWAQNTGDGGDIAFTRSTDGGTTFSTPVRVNSRPGSDRSQWFPTLTVDQSTGRLFITYLDQGIATSGDMTEVTVVSSANGGVSFTKPVPLTPAPFRAGWGNDTGQPNLGDYNYIVAQNGELFSAHATTTLPRYDDGQPTSGSLNTPDLFFRRTALPATPSVRLAGLSVVDTGGNGLIDAGDQVQLTIPLANYVTNALNAASVTGVSATLSSTTPGVTIVRGSSTYPDIAAGSTSSNGSKFVARVASNFVPGTPIAYTLNVTTSQGNTSFTGTLPTGTPKGTTIFSENFDATAAGSLPTGWTASHAGGTPTVPWTTSSSAFRAAGAPNNGLFHQNANDGTTPAATAIRFERAFSPLIAIPTGFDYYTIEMDIAYNTEDDPSYNVLAYDGFTLRVTDQTTGRTLRSVLLEAFADQITTGNAFHFPKHLPRNNSASYFQDMSVWGGFSNGFKHVRATIPAAGFAGSTVQLRFEFTQDSGGTAFDVRPQDVNNPALATSGVVVDNVLIRGVKSVSVELASLKLTPVAGQTGTFTAVVTSQAVAGTGGITATLAAPGTVTLPPNATIPAGATSSAPFMVTVAPAGYNTPVTVSATAPTTDSIAGNVRTATVLVRP